MKNIILGFFLLCGTWSLNAQDLEQYKRLISAKALHEDVDILKKNLEAVHAGLYTYTSKERMDAAFLNIKNQITAPMTQVAFYRLVLPLHDKIKNGHTLIIPPESWGHAVDTKLPHFPFDVYKYKKKLYVLRNLSEAYGVDPGTEIVSINGKPAIEVFEQMVDNWTKDGNNRTYANEIIQQDFSEIYAHIFGTPNSFEIALSEDGTVINEKVEALTIAKMRSYSVARYQHEKRPWYNDVDAADLDFKVDGKTAILTIPSFRIDYFKDAKTDFRKYFKESFTRMHQEKVRHLIIDLRENGGGNGDIAGEVFSYLHDRPFKLVNEIYTITKRIPNKKYYLGSQFGTTLQMKLALKKIGPNKYRPRNWAGRKNLLSLTARKPSSPRFDGKVYVLIGGWSFSASGIFTGLMKEHQRGVFIGEEAGGNPHTQIGDFDQMLILPNSGVRLNIPLLFETWAVSFQNTGHGVQPQHWVRNTIAQEIKKEDAVLQYTLALIKKSENSH